MSSKRTHHKAFPSTFTTPESYMDMKAAAQHRLHQKVGGIHFLRIGRLRMSFCVARAPVKDEPFWERQPSDYGRLALAVVAIGTVLLSSHGIASDWGY